ncbi:helix-turn-helix domain-containing protein [Paenibacillus sp. ClWae2A]|uniref:MarR family transcriptional regulator n=1 Tax=Paenibacillus sp. ClWae2A TaxID=3057177 RepID=UPI0028F4DF54|nr:helix-turn-helix domain-containing protein [Paenibacillus sp. ClWae2A]MDT9719649.1 helix-turn-helix domain-containing protein [Paenibacillus sp. ClWae2A]
MNNKSKVQNPLTIIAIFAGIAELAGTTVLLGLPLEIQSVFVWFVMLFPIGLVTAFFLVLLFKHKVLYAPSDFVDESNFMNLLQNKKVQNELIEVVDLLQQIKESNTTNEQLKDALNEAMLKLERTKESNENYIDHFNKKIKLNENLSYSVEDPSLAIASNLIEIVKSAGNEGITKSELARKLGRSVGRVSIMASRFVNTKLIRLEDNVYYYNVK